jgi:uncharacterized protein YdiU (UPF0061 family)
MELAHRFVDSLKADPETRNYCRQVRDAHYSWVEPTPVSDPSIIAFSAQVAELLGIDPGWFSTPEAASFLAGNRLLPGSKPYAMCYGGHQFGNWAGQLGDGRAINLGEKVAPDGSSWTLQLKGSGRTPYSRAGDGLAVLRSSLREYLCSEAMHHLGVPTTRALSLVLTGEQVTRDMFYDGRPQQEPGAIVCRVARSFVRFGNFEIFAARKEHENLKSLVDFTIRHDYSHIDMEREDAYAQWFEEVCTRTARMIIHWMRVGFVHGVMNTDNMSILGETIDYGPYGWVDHYDLGWTPNTTDAEGRRYAFGAQPRIAHWNLLQLANALWPIVEREEPLQNGLNRYAEVLQTEYRQMMASKLGLNKLDQDEDATFLDDLDRILQLSETDMTLFYRKLASLPISDCNLNEVHDRVSIKWLQSILSDVHYHPKDMNEEAWATIRDWMIQYVKRLVAEGLPDRERASRMNRVNPLYVLRNYLAQQAIDEAEKGQFQEIERLAKVLSHPYDQQPGAERYCLKRPEWARNKAGCSMLSCSS